MQFTERFEKYWNYLRKWEGTYANDPVDRGGETFMGVCRKYFPKLKVWNSLDKLKTFNEKKNYKPTDEELYEIKKMYYDNFYNRVRADEYNNEKLALQVADFANGSGVITAIKKLQQMLGVKVDGIIGPKTMEAANTQSNVAERFRAIRNQFYDNIVKNNPSQVKFIKGWHNRANNCAI